MDQVTWGALALVLTIVGGAYTWWAFRTKGAAAGTRGLALTLLPPAAWATGTLRMFTRIVDAVVDWLTHLVFSPLVWLGVVLAGLSVLLFGASSVLKRIGAGGGGTSEMAVGRKKSAGELGEAEPPPPGPAVGSPVDDDLADIEAILKKRGIT